MTSATQTTYYLSETLLKVVKQPEPGIPDEMTDLKDPIAETNYPPLPAAEISSPGHKYTIPEKNTMEDTANLHIDWYNNYE